ncbi:hypothetical protein LX36DRAFT_705126 [Colletotrichum falcatum]|nr:hypothetical protein LX36DRAFT_705126 [Colletotrichum falcatum]
MDAKGFQSVGTWKRYKLGQARFTDWLKQTASKFKPSPSPSPPAAIGASNAKKKADADSTSEKVHWTELEGLAEIIVTNSRPEEIPWDPILVLRDVVLEKVLGLLEKAATPKAKKEEPPKKRQRFSMNVLDDMFNLLQLHKPGHSPKNSGAAGPDEMQPRKQAESDASGPESGGSDAESKLKASRNKRKPARTKGKGGKKGKRAHNHKPAEKKTKPASDAGWVDRFQITETIDDDDDDDDDDLDFYMLIYCFFEDFNAIRTYVCERWCDYFYDKSVSLDTLAVITNAAAELFRDMENDLLRLLRNNGLQELQSYDSMMQLLFFDYGMEHVDYSEDAENKEELHESIWRNEADWLGWAAYVSIEHILERSPPGKVALFPPSAKKPPKYGPITAHDFSRFSQACMFELFPEVAETKALKKNQQEPPVIPGQPELELDFEQVLNTRRYPSCFIFSLQLYLDIRNILDDHVKDARQQLQATARAAVDDMKKAMTSCDEVWSSEWREMAEQYIESIQHYALSDFTYDDKTLRARNMGVTEKLSEFDLFDTEPVWPSLLDFRTKVEMTALSIRLLTRTPAPLWAGVLYHASRRDHPGMPAWPEMDKFLGVHGTGLLGFPVTEDLKAADVLARYSTMSDGKRYHVWMELLEKVSRVTDFWVRYGERTYNLRKRQDTNYISDIVRGHFGLPPDSRKDPFGISRERTPLKPESSCGDQKTQEMIRQVRMMGDMRHVEVLEILDQTVESMAEKEFAVNYFKLDWEVQTFVDKLKASMLDAGLLSSLEDGVEKIIEKPDVVGVLCLAVEKAILATADKPFVSRMANPPEEISDDSWTDIE